MPMAIPDRMAERKVAMFMYQTKKGVKNYDMRPTHVFCENHGAKVKRFFDFYYFCKENSQFTIHNSAAQREQSQACLNSAEPARNLDTKYHNSQFTIHNWQLPAVESYLV